MQFLCHQAGGTAPFTNYQEQFNLDLIALNSLNLFAIKSYEIALVEQGDARMPIQSKQHINQENFFVSPIGLIKIYRLKARNACALDLATSPVGARHVHKSCIDSNQRCHSIPIFFSCPVSFKIDVTGETSRTFGRKKRPKIIYSIPLISCGTVSPVHVPDQ